MQRIPQHKGDDPLGDKASPHQVIRHRGVAFFGGKTLREQGSRQSNAQRRHHAARHNGSHKFFLAAGQGNRAKQIRRFIDRPAKVNGHQSPQHRGQHHAAAALHTGQQLVYPGIKPSKRRIDEEYHHKADHGQAGHRI